MNMQHVLRPLALALVGGVVCLPDAAWADARSEARRYFRGGMEMVAQGNYEEGIASLRKAYEQMPHPVVLYNIGLAYIDAGDLLSAIEYLNRYVGTDPGDRTEVEQTIDRLKVRVQEGSVLAVTPPPPSSPATTARPRKGAVPRAPSSLKTDARQLAMLESTAAQYLAMAEVSESETLYKRARELQQLVDDLKRRGVRKSSTPRSKPTARQSQGRATPKSGAATPAVAATQAADFTDVYARKVVSASRFARTPLDAPNSTTIITEQDVRLTGLSIPDLLRRAAGVEVMTLTPGDSQVSIRGLNQRLSNKVLVLVNGRSVYLDFLGTTFWQLLPINRAEIERIEVIRGPASAIYGADATTGIVNIILKEPGQGQSSIRLGGGNGGMIDAAANVSGVTSGIAYRLGAGHNRSDQYSFVTDPERIDVDTYTSNPGKGLETTRFAAELRTRPAAGWLLRGGTRLSASQTSFQSLGRQRELYAENVLYGQSFVEASSPSGLGARVFWNIFESDAQTINSAPGGVDLSFRDNRSNVVDAEVTFARSFDFLVEHNLAAGVGYRFKSIEWKWITDSQTENHFSAFVEDTLNFSDAVLLSLSGRLDRHPLLDGLQVSPRVALVVRPTQDIALRATAASAFRSPAFLESYLDLNNATSIRAISALGKGNLDLDPERLFSVELGYAHELGDVLSLEVNGYYNTINDQILLTRVIPYSLGNYPGYNDGDSTFPVAELQYENDAATFRQVGGEAGVRVFPVKGLDFYVNYALHDTSPTDDSLDLGGREFDERTSTHKFNAGIQYRSNFGLDLALDANLVTEQVWVEQIADPDRGVVFTSFRLPSYVLVNARAGWRVWDDRLEFGVVGTNLLDQRHRQHPFGQNIGIRVLGTTTLRF